MISLKVITPQQEMVAKLSKVVKPQDEVLSNGIFELNLNDGKSIHVSVSDVGFLQGWKQVFLIPIEQTDKVLRTAREFLVKED